MLGRNTLQDVKLPVGASRDTVKVSGTEPLLGRGIFGQHRAGAFVHRGLPLNGRRYTDFTLLTPNTSPDGSTDSLASPADEAERTRIREWRSLHWFAVDSPNATSNYLGHILGRYKIPYLMAKTESRSFKSRSTRTRRSTEVREASLTRSPVGKQRVPWRCALLQSRLRDQSE